MPRPKGIRSYGLHRPTGQARVRIDGQDVYLGTHGAEQSRRKYEELEAADRRFATPNARRIIGGPGVCWIVNESASHRGEHRSGGG